MSFYNLSYWQLNVIKINLLVARNIDMLTLRRTKVKGREEKQQGEMFLLGGVGGQFVSF